ncbi:relaxase/mobilization nuclease domain-containing protein [Vibrio aestuarianus]|uniref:relaxase/mobilization nuclease domain-containing protein n=1 Tax=Vibrio aestuarianus TaxID=28171 RepID=UPI003B9706AB
MQQFVDEVKETQRLHKRNHKRRATKHLYDHVVVSFSETDDKKYNQYQQMEIIIKALKTDKNFKDIGLTPYVIWPQEDSGKRHYHMVISRFNYAGEFRNNAYSKLELRKTAMRAEKAFKLTKTQQHSKKAKKNLHPNTLNSKKAAYQHKNDQIAHDRPMAKKALLAVRSQFYDYPYQNEKQLELSAKAANVDVELAKNADIDKIKTMIHSVYKQSGTGRQFLQKLIDTDIEYELLTYKDGRRKGIIFKYGDSSVSGSKVHSSMALGKMKRRFSDLDNFLVNGLPETTLTNSDQKLNLDFSFTSKNYKQTVDLNGDILLYYHKKNINKNPNNFNLRINKDRTTITFSPKSANIFDLRLALELAKESGWTKAVLTSEDKDYFKRLLAESIKMDSEQGLFFVRAKTLKLTFEDLIEIHPNITFDQATKLLIDGDLLESNDDQYKLAGLAAQQLIRHASNPLNFPSANEIAIAEKLKETKDPDKVLALMSLDRVHTGEEKTIEKVVLELTQRPEQKTDSENDYFTLNYDKPKPQPKLKDFGAKEEVKKPQRNPNLDLKMYQAWQTVVLRKTRQKPLLTERQWLSALQKNSVKHLGFAEGSIAAKEFAKLAYRPDDYMKSSVKDKYKNVFKLKYQYKYYDTHTGSSC